MIFTAAMHYNLFRIRFLSLLSVILLGSLISCDFDSDNDKEIIDPTEPVTVAIKRVVDYSPAPGQFINLYPAYTAGMTIDDINAAACELLNSGYMVSLGAFGGSITLELERPITNTPGSPDLLVKGNAISNSSEPGIVYVSTNGADWFMLEGEHFVETLPRTTITYYPGEEPAWNTADGRSGKVSYLPQYNDQPYWPQWVENPITVEGFELPGNAVYNTATGQYDFTAYRGYADSWPNRSEEAWLFLEDAIDPVTGDQVKLSSISYVKIMTGTLLMNGPLGESSTEISGICSRN